MYLLVLIIIHESRIIDNLNLFINNVENILKIKLSFKRVSFYCNYFFQPTVILRSINFLERQVSFEKTKSDQLLKGKCTIIEVDGDF